MSRWAKVIRWLRSVGSGDTNSTGPGSSSRRWWPPGESHMGRRYEGEPPPPPYPPPGDGCFSYVPPPLLAPPPAPQPMQPFDAEGCRNYRVADALAIVKAIEFLRREEGNSVDILCDNPDFNGQPNNAVECCCEWTEWEVGRFTGNTLLEALEAAVAAKRKAGQ